GPSPGSTSPTAAWKTAACTSASRSSSSSSSQPVADEQERSPVARVAVARVGEQALLRGLQRRDLGLAGGDALVEVHYERAGGLVVHEPERGERAARAGLDRDAGEAERGAIVSRRG